jgi:hypothetical protein
MVEQETGIDGIDDYIHGATSIFALFGMPSTIILTGIIAVLIMVVRLLQTMGAIQNCEVALVG